MIGFSIDNSLSGIAILNGIEYIVSKRYVKAQYVDAVYTLMEASHEEVIMNCWTECKKVEKMTDKISMDKEYVTRIGESVRLLCVDSGHNIYPVVGLLDGIARMWTKDGFFDVNRGTGTDTDLIEKPKPITKFINIYSDGYTGHGHKNIPECYQCVVQTHDEHLGYLRIDIFPDSKIKRVNVSFQAAKESDNE